MRLLLEQLLLSRPIYVITFKIGSFGLHTLLSADFALFVIIQELLFDNAIYGLFHDSSNIFSNLKVVPFDRRFGFWE